MARFYGEIGYGEMMETAPGVYEDVITEVPYFGDVIRNTRRLSEGEHLNNDLSVNNSISIIADQFANENFHAIRYIRYSGALWTVSEVQVEAPRLVLRLGVRYNGPVASVTP